MPKKILVCGDAMLDRYWSGGVERISPEAPVPVVHVTREEERPGGAANVALNCAALGADVTLLSVIGDDEHGRILSTLMDGVAARFIKDRTMPTIVKLRVMGRSQQIVRTDFEAAPSSETIKELFDIYAELVAKADAVVFSDYGKGALISIALLIGQARKRGLPIYIDPKGYDYTNYRGATLLKPNRNEMRQVLGGWADEKELTSEEGMSLYSDAGVYTDPAISMEVYDVTGAGDTVLAVMATLDCDIEERMRFANRAGAIVCRHLGTAVVTRKELGLD